MFLPNLTKILPRIEVAVDLGTYRETPAAAEAPAVESNTPRQVTNVVTGVPFKGTYTININNINFKLPFS